MTNERLIRLVLKVYPISRDMPLLPEICKCVRRAYHNEPRLVHSTMVIIADIMIDLISNVGYMDEMFVDEKLILQFMYEKSNALCMYNPTPRAILGAYKRYVATLQRKGLVDDEYRIIPF